MQTLVTVTIIFLAAMMRCVWDVWGRREVYTGFWWRNLRDRDHLEDPGVDGKIILRLIFRKWDVGTWTGSSSLRIGTGIGHLQMW